MGHNSNASHSKLDTLKWSLIFACLLAGIYANHHFAQVEWALRAAVGIVLLCALLALALQTKAGHRAWVFIKSARTELHKVVWPTRQETVQTTLVVMAMVTIAALILWGVDALFLWAVSWLTGQRG